MAKNVQLTVDIKGGDSVGKAAEKTKSLKQELRELKSELASGNLTGKAFDEAAARAGKLQDTIGDVNQQVKNLASDTGKLDGFVSLAQGITGGFAAAQGAMALFGGENEDLQKQLVKIQGSVALLNGVQQVANTLNKDSALMTQIQATRLKILTFVQTRYTMAVGTTTGAMKLLRIAGMAIPILALVTGITLLIANFDKVKNVVMKFLGPLGTLAKYIGGLVEQFTDFVGITSDFSRALEANEKAANDLNKQREKDIEILEALGGQEDKIYRKKLAMLTLERQILGQKKLANEASKEEIEKYKELDTVIEVLKITEKNRLDSIAKKRQEENQKAAQERAKNKAKALEVAKEDINDKVKAFEGEQAALKQARLDAEFELEAEQEAKAQKQKEFEDAENQRKLDSIDAVNAAELDAKQYLEDAKIGIAQQSAQFLQQIAGKQKGIALAALAIEKGAAIADVIIQGQRANAKLTTLYPAPANIPFVLANNIRTGLSVATIAATGISGAKSISSGGSGGAVQPPSIRGTQTQRDSNSNQRQPDTKVFVTETDIRSVTRKVDGIYSQATIR